MTTIEKLLVEIFEKKKRIVDQVKHRTHLFDQHLASICLLDGIAPPPWLWSQPQGHNDLSKEELISGLLLPRLQPAFPYSTTHSSLYRNPAVVTADNVELPDGLYAGVHASSKGFDAGNGSSVLPHCSISDAECAFDGVPEMDFSVTSPQDCGDARSSDNQPEPALSLARIQRSKSRQRALEIRNSAKASRSRLRDKSGVGACASRFAGSRIAFLQSDHVDESELVKPVDVCNESYTVDEEKVGDRHSKKRGVKSYSGRITRSRSSHRSPSTLNEPSKLGYSSYVSKEDGGTLTESIIITTKQPNHVNESLDLVNLSVVSNGSFGVRKAEVGVNGSKEKGSSIYCGRITRSRSSSQKNNVNVFPKLESFSNIVKDDGCALAEPFDKSARPPLPLIRTRGEGETLFHNAQGHQLSAVRLSPSQKDSEVCAASAREHLGKFNSVERGVAQNTGSQATCTIERMSKAVGSSISGHIVTQSRFAASNNTQNEQATMSEERSLPGQTDLELCMVSTREHLDKETIVDQYAGKSARPETACIIEETLKPVNSKTSGCQVPGSRSTASNKSLLDKSLNRFAGVDLQEVLGAQVNVLPCAESSDNIVLERYDAVVAETDTDSDRLVKARSVSSGSNIDGARLRAGLEDLVSRELPECAMVVKPKQLDFDDVEEYSLNETSSPALEKKKDSSPSEKRSFTLLHSVDTLGKLTSVHCQESFKSTLKIPLPEEQEVLSKDKKPWRGSSEAHVEETDGASRTTNLNVGSSVKETSEVYIDAGMHTSQERNKISEQLPLIDHSTPLQVAHDNSLLLKDAVGSNLSNVNADTSIEFSFEKGIGEIDVVKPTEGGNLDTDACGGPKISAGWSNLSNINADTSMEFSFEKGIGEIDVVKPTKPVSEGGNSDTDACGGPKISADADFAVLTGCDPLRNPDITLRDFEIEYPSAVSVDKIKGNSVQQKMNSVCINDDKNAVCSKSSECLVAKKSIQPGLSFSFDMEGPWPQHKRRKVEGQLTDVLSASPSLRDEDDVQSNVNMSLIGEIDQNVEHHMIGEYESSHNLQVDEGELSMEEKDRSVSAPFTSVHGELGAPFVSSLAKQATRDSHGCLLDEAEVADPTTTIFDSRRQYALEENQDLENKIELGNTEHLICSERSMQERKSYLGENGKLSYGSGGSPLRQSMALIGADQTMPEFEGFIMQDNAQPCVAGQGISFEKLELPNSAIERASVLEQLCKSACMHTPLSHFSTTYKLHKTPNLYQSVPNGLLECMDLRSTLPINDAFHRRSHSDCLPFSSTQSAWDIKKPHTSPVGKLWDKITSNCGSSEKRGSLNPELPCISEENENPDEIADAFQECPEVMTCSVKREPLADITESPNLPVSVSEVEICAGRNSLDSVNTEFSFTGTHNMVKQKLENHNSNNRRCTNKVKEKQSILCRENGTKRVSESVRNKFSKPKLSGKNSLRKEGPSISRRESKRNNIVSNITSFIPLVQQKQAAAVITGKRDVKVKSLEAAEAAKRLQEKKDNERKKKKEDLRLERARLEEENRRQMELQKKKKEEERKKKEADMAVRKRQREEEERKEKERKRKRVEEKLCARKDEKELKWRTMDERVHERKESKDETGKDKKMEKEIGDENLGKISEIEPLTSTSDTIKASIVPKDCVASSGCGDLKVMSNIDQANLNTSQEQSYDISPYKSSDDEDEDEDDDIPNSKFIPSWASKKSLAVVISTQKRVDPEVIFPPESFCSIAEVLLPRKP